jgi:hypothetical protein
VKHTVFVTFEHLLVESPRSGYQPLDPSGIDGQMVTQRVAMSDPTPEKQAHRLKATVRMRTYEDVTPTQVLGFAGVEKYERVEVC